jgi:hypothetical protein
MLNISYGRQQSFICVQCILLCFFANLQLINHINMLKKHLKNIQISIIKHKEHKQSSLPFFLELFCLPLFDSFFLVCSFSPLFLLQKLSFFIVASLSFEPREDYEPYYFLLSYHQ